MRGSNFKTILAERDRYRTLWSRTYAPLRRAIAGNWRVLPEDSHSEVRFDTSGSFEMRFFDSGVFLKGRYTVVAVEGNSYLVLDSDGVPYMLRLEEIDSWRMKLRWEGPGGSSFEVSRHEAKAKVFVA